MKEETKDIFNPEKHLLEDEQENFKFVKSRVEQLKQTRTDVFGQDLESIWREADGAYVPHRLKTTGKRVFASDEDLGWRGGMTTIGDETAWQSDVAQPNPFVKTQVALSILIDRNPEGVLTAGASRFENTTKLMKQLYQRSWEMARSKSQLKLFIFNLAKYGWAIGRTYPLKIERTIKNITSYNEEEPEKSEWEEKKVCEYNEIFRENLDPWNCWIDDLTRPNNSLSIRDWCWRKVYSYDQAKEEFGKYKRFKYVQPTQVEAIEGEADKKEYQDKDLVEAVFYENKIKDLFTVTLNKIPVVIEPLPISDSEGNKKLSCWQTFWVIRHAESPYGIGLYEAMRYNTGLYDRIVNMTIDQLTLAIYKMFFYSGTDTLSETGEIKITPGQGMQVSNPKDITWMEVPGPGAEAWKGIEFMKKAVDEASGITDPLMGEIVGKTAFETAQAKEAALKRLKGPLENITEALETEGYITVSLIQMLYSVPETYKIVDEKLIEAYLQEVKADPDLYERDEEGGFTAKVYPEAQLNLDTDDKGNLVETKDTRFFRIKPKYLKWNGVIRIRPQSILAPSKELTKAMDLEFANILIPLLVQPPEIYIKTAKQLCKVYEKDPEDWLPDPWLQGPPGPEDQPLMVPKGEERPEGGAGGETPTGDVGRVPGQMNPVPPREAPRARASAELPGKQSLAGKIMNRMIKPMRMGK